jgi:hypothetical protein
MDGAAWEDHGSGPCNPRAFDKGDERVADQSVNSCPILPLLIDCTSEKFAKKLIGRTDVEDAFKRIDSLTKDENMMGVAKTLEVAFDINSNVEGLQALVGSAHADVQAMSENLGAIKEGTQCFLSDLAHIPTISRFLYDRYGRT